MSKQRSLILLLLIVIFGVALRSYLLTTRSIWFDESFSWRLIQFPMRDLIIRDASDVHPPLYYILLKSWGTVFGKTILSLRLFSVAFAAASIVMIYTLTAELLHGVKAKLASQRGTGLVAALLLAVSGWQIPLAWEARMYTLGTFFTLLSTWLLVKAYRQKQSRLGPWLWYGLAAVAFLYTHYYASFTLMAQGLVVIAAIIIQSGGRIGEIFLSKKMWHALTAALVGIILFAPWLPTLLHQMNRVEQDFWITPPDKWSIPETVYHMIVPSTSPLTHEFPAAFWTLAPTLAGIVGVAILLIICWHKGYSSPHMRWAGWLIVLCGSLPFVTSFILSLFTRSVYTDRFFAFNHLFFMIGVATLIHFIPRRWLKVGTVTLLTVTSSFLYYQYWHELSIPSRPGTHGAVSFLKSTHKDAEPVFATSPFVFFPALHYIQEEYGNSVPLRLLSGGTPLNHINGGSIALPGDTFPIQDVSTLNASTVWLIDTTGFYNPTFNMPAPWRMVTEKKFPEVFNYQGDIIVRKYAK